MNASSHKREVGGIVVDGKQPWRTENLGRLFLEALSAFERTIIEGLHEAGFEFVRQVHVNVVRHIDREGTRMSDIAARLGITAGAATQAVELCVCEGLVALSIDEHDKRVRRVWFTKKGKRVLDVVHRLYDEIEEETRELIGDQALASMRKSLLRLQEASLEAEQEKT